MVRSFPLAVQLLLVNQLGVNTGFYLLIPYLAGYLGGGLGLSAALVGVVLGVRNLSQQGLSLIGGTAADRFGARNVIIAGCALRAVGFGLFALGTSLPVLLGASVLSGLAGALFNPAVRAYVAVEAGERKEAAFSLFNVVANAGALIGPLLGSALILVNFRVSALVAAGIFAVLTLAQAVLLPRRRVEPATTSVLSDWREVFTDRRFLAFTAALTGLFVLESQLYFVLPLHAERFTGSAGTVAAIFLVSTVATLAFQVPVTERLRSRWSRGRSIAVGLALAGGGFAVTGVASALVPPTLPTSALDAVLRLAPVLLTALCLAFGLMCAKPFVDALIPSFGRDGLPGAYYGVFYLASGVTAAAGNAVIGWAADAGGTRWPWLPSVLCLAIGLASAAAVRHLDRLGAVGPLPDNRRTTR